MPLYEPLSPSIGLAISRDLVSWERLGRIALTVDHPLSTFATGYWKIIRQLVLWLVSGLLIGVGFVSAFSGGGLLLLAGLVIGVTLFVRNRGHWQGWPALLFGAGISTALLLLPYVLRPSHCAAGVGSGCYRGFTVGTFAVALLVAVLGLAFAVVEVRRGRRP